MTPAERTEQIARYRNMVQGDPEDDLAQFRLGQALMEDGQYAEAVDSFERTLKLSPGFSRVYQYLGECLVKEGRKEQAVEVLTKGWTTADERGDRLPREAIAKLLVSLGAAVPAPAAPKVEDDGPDTGFRCSRPGCMEGKRAKPLAAPPVSDGIGARIQANICSSCWTLWLKDQSVKVINELRLDLSSDFGQGEYDRHMREFFGFEDAPKA